MSSPTSKLRVQAAVFAAAFAATALLAFHTGDHHDALRGLGPAFGPALHPAAGPGDAAPPDECDLCLAAGQARSAAHRNATTQLLPAPSLAGASAPPPAPRVHRGAARGPATPRAPPAA